MPQRDLTLPKALAIAHDVAAYFQSVRGIDKLSDVESRAVTRLARLRSRVHVVRDRTAPITQSRELEWWCEMSDGRA